MAFNNFFSKLEKATPGDTVDGKDDVTAWIKKNEHDIDNQPNEFVPPILHYHHDDAREPPHAEITGPKGTIGPPEATFLYLDVGAWIGSMDESKRKWAPKRDFGVICGEIVMVCTFKDACEAEAKIRNDNGHTVPVPVEDPEWKKTFANRKGDHVASLKKLLALLEPLMGGVIVRRVMECPHAYAPRPEQIHAIFGDMHVPVIGQFEETYAPTFANGDWPSDPAVVEAAFRTQQARVKAMTDDQKKTERVGRFGRLNLAPIEVLVKGYHGVGGVVPNSSTSHSGALGPIRDFANGLMDVKDKVDKLPSEAKVVGGVFGVLGISAALTAAIQPVIAAAGVVGALKVADAVSTGVGGPTTAQSIKGALDNLGDRQGIEDDTMTVREAESWWTYYKQGDIDPKAKPADIFEDAGNDWLAFMKAVQKYKANNSSSTPVQVHQLGDMLDFWVGFTCHFTPSLPEYKFDWGLNENPVADLKATSESKHYGERLVNYWTMNLFDHSPQGAVLDSAFDVITGLMTTKDPKGEGWRPPVYHWGNHDNYLGKTTPRYKGGKKPLAQRVGTWQDYGMFMEHGHQRDSSNADNSPVLPASPIVGTDGPLGTVVTQAAFIRPGPVRGFEGKAVGLVSRIKATYGQRFDQIAAAAEKFTVSPWAVYVMGHTHEACLCKVIIRSDAKDRKDKVEEWKEGDGTKAQLWVRSTPSPRPRISTRSSRTRRRRRPAIRCSSTGTTSTPA